MTSLIDDAIMTRRTEARLRWILHAIFFVGFGTSAAGVLGFTSLLGPSVLLFFWIGLTLMALAGTVRGYVSIRTIFGRARHKA